MVLALCFLGMAESGARAIEWFRIGHWHFDAWVDEFERLVVGRLFVELIGLVADCVPDSTDQTMPVVIENFAKRSFVNNRLIAFETGALFSFECLHRDGAEFDSTHDTPRLRVAFEDLNSIKSRFAERGEKSRFGQCP